MNPQSKDPKEIDKQIREKNPLVHMKVETYQSMRKPATFVDVEYGEWETTPQSVLNRGGKHPNRKKNPRKRKPEDVEAQIQQDRPYIRLKYDTFTNMDVTATFIDDDYGEWETRPKTVLEGCGHPARTNSQKITKDLFEQKVKELLPHSKIVSYSGLAETCTMLDNEYGEWSAKANSIFRHGADHPRRKTVGIWKPDELEREIQKERPFISLKHETFVNMKTKAIFVDADYGEWEAVPSKVLWGRGNPKRAENKDKTRRTAQDIEQQIQKERPYIGLVYGSYEGVAKKATFVDAYYGEWESVVRSVLQGCNHPKRAAASQTSKLEIKLGEALGIEKNSVQLQLNSRYIVPDFVVGNLLIECDGLYWHSDKFKEKWHHFKRREEAEECGYELLQFYEDEINDKLPIICSIIRNKMGKSNKIYARKCELIELNASEAYPFFEENHLMGGTRLNAFGLLYAGELVQAMSFQNRPDGVHIGRFCSRQNYQVVGGQSKLLKAIKQKFPDKPIINFVDLRYGNGKNLENFGFKLEKITLGWKWTSGQQTYNRLQCRANMDERKLTQAEHAEELGWCKVYDAGQAKYIMSM